MDRLKFLLSRSGVAWTLKHGDREQHFPTQAEAMHEAVEAASSAFENGYLAEVLVQDEQGHWRMERTYGKDPVPARD